MRLLVSGSTASRLWSLAWCRCADAYVNAHEDACTCLHTHTHMHTHARTCTHAYAVVAGRVQARAAWGKEREERMRVKAASLASARREIEALQPQQEAALRRMEAQFDAERASFEAEVSSRR